MTDRKKTPRTPRPTRLAAAVLATTALACGAPVSNGTPEDAVEVEVNVDATTAQATATAAPTAAAIDALTPEAAATEAETTRRVGAKIRIVGSNSFDLEAAEWDSRPLVYVDGVRMDREVAVEQAPQPLVYVDGVRVDSDGASREEVLAALDPSTIARIEVIKGAAAEKLYGDEGSNGVIQIFLNEEEDADGIRRVLGSVLSGIGEGISKTGEGIKKAGERLRKK